MVAAFAGRLRDWPLTAALLDGLNAGAVGLMVVVSAQLALSAIVDPLTVALAAGAAIALLVWSPSSVLLLVLGGAIGLAAAWAEIGP